MTQSLYETKPKSQAVSDQNGGTNGVNTNYSISTSNGFSTKSGTITNGGINTNGTKNDINGGTEHAEEQRENQVNEDDIVKPLEEFKIDLDTQSVNFALLLAYSVLKFESSMITFIISLY